MPSGMRTAVDILLAYSIGLITSIPSFAADLFFALPFARLVRVRSNRSTGSKQTLNGLFICALRLLAQLSGSLLSLMSHPLQDGD